MNEDKSDCQPKSSAENKLARTTGNLEVRSTLQYASVINLMPSISILLLTRAALLTVLLCLEHDLFPLLLAFSVGKGKAHMDAVVGWQVSKGEA